MPLGRSVRALRIAILRPSSNAAPTRIQSAQSPLPFFSRSHAARPWRTISLVISAPPTARPPAFKIGQRVAVNHAVRLRAFFAVRLTGCFADLFTGLRAFRTLSP